MKRMNLKFLRLSTEEVGKYARYSSYILCSLVVIIAMITHVTHVENELRELRIKNAELNLKLAQVDKRIIEETIRAKGSENSLDRRFMDLIYYIDNGVGRGG